MAELEGKLSDSDKKFIEGRLSNFTKSFKYKAEAAKLLLQRIPVSEVFRIISEKRGKGKSHVSGKYKEGKVRGS